MIKWNEVTWYSKLGAIIFFLGCVPILCFYIGTQYQSTVQNTIVPTMSDSSDRTVAIAVPQNTPSVTTKINASSTLPTSSNKSSKDFSGTVSQALVKMGDENCSYTKIEMNPYVGGDVTYFGNVLTSGEKFKIDRKSAAKGLPVIEGHVIFDGNFVYSWVGNNGFKIDKNKLFPTSSRWYNNQDFLDPGQDLTRVYEFTCNGTNSEPNAFLPPTNVIFVSLPPKQ